MKDRPKNPGAGIRRGRVRMVRSYSWNTWSQDCPEGTWTGRLEKKGWAKSPNIALYFRDVATEARYWVLVSPELRNGSHDFMNDAEPGDVFELTTTKAKVGDPSLIIARRIAALARD